MQVNEFVQFLNSTHNLSPNFPIVIGVSGGADSLCLLDLMTQAGYPLIIGHFDHKLRPESASDAAFVKHLADQRSIPFVLGSQDVNTFANETRHSIEEAARILRYQFLFELARQNDAQAVAVGHTADDQIETVLMHLIRGAGLAGLKGMEARVILPAWDEKIPLIRPLLRMWRNQTVAYCQQQGLDFRDDLTNADTTYFRNRLRHELVPHLESFNPQVRLTLLRMTRVLAGDYHLLEDLTLQEYDRVRLSSSRFHITLSHSKLKELQPALMARLIRYGASRLLPDMRDFDSESLENSVRWLQTAVSGQRQGLPYDLALVVGNDRVDLIGPEGRVRDPAWPQLEIEVAQAVPIPGMMDLGDDWVFTTERMGITEIESITGEDPWQAWVDLGDDPMVVLRSRRPGDRFQPLGFEEGSMKVSDFFTNEQLPQLARNRWPLVWSGDRLAWIPGFRPADWARITPDTRDAVHMTLKRKPGQQ